MQYIIRKIWDLPQRRITDPAIYQRRGWHRREFLRSLGLGGVGLSLLGTAGCGMPQATSEEIEAAGAPNLPPPAVDSVYPAPRNPEFDYGRDETDRLEAAQFTNFYEFTGPTTKAAYRYVGDFQPSPWTVEVDGLCDQPTAFDLDDLFREFTFEERAYRFRCVETWAMCVPWTGFPLANLIARVGPKSSATHVQFQTFNRPDEARFMGIDTSYPWPYTEGLTLAEATNPLAFLATGIYGEPLPKQHGSPVRLVLPWKYGFKSIKSIVRITLTDKPPATFWNTVAPREYDFQANVNPNVPHPRWSQQTEWMLGTKERFQTVIYNGYGEYVGGLYG
jgi:methionine sulfoxide reductase catalytic subunit